MVTVEPLPLTPTGRTASSPPRRSIVNNTPPWKSTPLWSEGPWSAHYEDSPSVNQWNRRFLPQSKRTPTPKSRIQRGVTNDDIRGQLQEGHDLLRGVMRINATDSLQRSDELGGGEGGSSIASISEGGMRHETTPREHNHHQNNNNNPQFKIQNTSPKIDISVKKRQSSEGVGAQLRGSEVMIAGQYTTQKTSASPRALTTPTLQTIGPFHEHNRERDGTAGGQGQSTCGGGEWERSSLSRNMAGTQQHYMVYLRDLRQKQDWDLSNQHKRVDSSIHRLQQSKQSRTIKSACAQQEHHTLSSSFSRSGARTAGGGGNRMPHHHNSTPPHMCGVNEHWDVRQSQATQTNTATVGNGTNSSSPMDISKRKKEFSRELSFVQQTRHKQPSIRTSVTPRMDEGVLDWLLRSVTSVPLDSKYAPRSTNRLFKLSVHALQNRLTSGGTDVNMASGQGHDPSYVDPRSGASTSMSSAHGLYIDPNVRAQTAEANQRSRISPRSAGFVGSRAGGRTVKSAAAGRLDVNSDESTHERVESSRRLWSAHHQNNYSRRKTMPQVKESDLAFGSDVMKEYLSPRVCPDPLSPNDKQEPEDYDVIIGTDVPPLEETNLNNDSTEMVTSQITTDDVIKEEVATTVSSKTPSDFTLPNSTFKNIGREEETSNCTNEE